MFPKGGTVNSQQNQRLYLRSGESGDFGKFRHFKLEDPILSILTDD